jgi:hypothetical protein
MPRNQREEVNFRFTENNVEYSFSDVFVPSDIFVEGDLWAWGSRASGSLGNNEASTVGQRSIPITLPLVAGKLGVSQWSTVFAGSDYSAAIKTDGSLWLWGSNSGKLGNFQTNTRSTPITTFLGGNDWSSISLGRNHTAAIKTDGTLWLWGSCSYGQLGNFVGGITAFRSTPVTTFLGGNTWTSVSCGAFHTAAVKGDGSLWTWGRNNNGELGNHGGGTAGANSRSTPITTLSTGLTWSSVACGYQHTVAIKTDGSLWAWGYAANGNLGNANILQSRSTPITTLSTGLTWASVTCGSNHTVALKTDGTLWTWGSNSNGQLGVNNSTTRQTPVTTLLGGTNWKTLGRLNCETTSSVAIKTDGTLWTWGAGGEGQLGINATPIGRSTPVTTITGGYFWKSAAIGLNHGLGIQVATNDFI